MNNGKVKKERPIEVEESSGNVFRDLGLDEPDLLLAKSTLIIKIHTAMDKHGLTVKAMARLIGITSGDLNAILRGDLARYSEKELKTFVKSLRSLAKDSQNGKSTTSKISRVGR